MDSLTTREKEVNLNKNPRRKTRNKQFLNQCVSFQSARDIIFEGVKCSFGRAQSQFQQRFHFGGDDIGHNFTQFRFSNIKEMLEEITLLQ
jgi:hypothetical protein